MATESKYVLPPRRRRDGRFDLLMAIDHLLEGSQLYAKAVQDAALANDPGLEEYFRGLERNTRRQISLARELLERSDTESRTSMLLELQAELNLGRTGS
jgi:hypothetical protein